MEDRFDRLEQKLDQKFAEFNETLRSELRATENRLRRHIEDVDANIAKRLDDFGRRGAVPRVR